MQLWITTTIDTPDPVINVNQAITLEELGRFEFDPRTSGFAIRCMEYSAYVDEPELGSVEYTGLRAVAEFDEFGRASTRVQISLALFARSICDAVRLTRMRFENIHFGSMPGVWLEFWRELTEVDYLVHRITELVFDSCSQLDGGVLNLIRNFEELRTLSICNFIGYQGLEDYFPMEKYLGEHRHLEGIEFTSRDIPISEDALMAMIGKVERLRVSMGEYGAELYIYPYDAAS